MNINLIGVVICLVMLQAACHNSSTPDEARMAVLTAEREWAAAARNKDLQRSISFLADDAIMFPPGQGPLVGKGAIRDYIASSFATPGFSVTWEPEDVVVAKGGDLAYTHARSVYTFPGPDQTLQTLHGKGVAIWRKDTDGRWRCVVDIWNEAPAPGITVGSEE